MLPFRGAVLFAVGDVARFLSHVMAGVLEEVTTRNDFRAERKICCAETLSKGDKAEDRVALI